MTLQLPPSTFAPEPLLAIACPWCHAALAVTADLCGHPSRCPLCAGCFLAPRPPVEPAEPPPATPSADPDSPQWPTLTADSAVAEAASASRPRGELEFVEPVKTVGSGANTIQLHRLTPEEKAARRARRNLVLLVAGVSLLMAVVLIFGTKRPKRS
jgi:hypothetical protein